MKCRVRKTGERVSGAIRHAARPSSSKRMPRHVLARPRAHAAKLNNHVATTSPRLSAAVHAFHHATSVGTGNGAACACAAAQRAGEMRRDA